MYAIRSYYGIPRPQPPVDLDDRLVLGLRLGIGEQGVPHRGAAGERVEVEEIELVDAPRAQLIEVRLGQLLVALDDHLARRLVDDVPRITSYNVCYTKLLRTL